MAEICLNNELEIHANNPTLILRLTSDELLSKINYLRSNNIPIDYKTSNGKIKINSIFGMSNKNMQKKYGISKKELVKDYLV